MEFVVTVEPEIIDVLGADKDAATKLKLKAAAQEVLTNLLE